MTTGVPSVRAVILARAKSAVLDYGKHTVGVSIELSDAPAGPTPSARVSAWIRTHKGALQDAERKFSISRWAIAAAISFEALEDVAPLYIPDMAHWSGPGKVHYKEYRLAEGDPVAKQVESIGLLPRASMEHRAAILSTPEGAITYIAAIMHAYDHKMQKITGYSIRCDVSALLALYTTSDLQHFPSPLQLQTLETTMPTTAWTKRYVAVYTSAGDPNSALCHNPRGHP